MMKADIPFLYSLVLTLSPTATIEMGVKGGHQAHAAFLDTIQGVDPALSAALHSSKIAIRPFTVSGLQGVPHPRKGTVHLRPGQTCWLRVTLLYRSIYDRLMQVFLEDQRLQLRLGEAVFLIREVLVAPGSHPWAGYATWEGLLEGAHLDRVITLEFASPTAFRQGDLDLPLPIPRLIFSSYLQKWNRYSGVPFDRELLTTIERHVGLKEHNIKTIPFNDGRVTIPGFEGRCTFFIKGKLEEDVVRQINCLADFAFYAGTGRKTTHGMGMTRRIK